MIKGDFKPSKNWEWREYSKGSLIENGIALNESATYIWKMCDGKNSIKQIEQDYAKYYSIDESLAKEDVTKTIETLVKEKALNIEDES